MIQENKYLPVYFIKIIRFFYIKYINLLYLIGRNLHISFLYLFNIRLKSIFSLKSKHNYLRFLRIGNDC